MCKPAERAAPLVVNSCIDVTEATAIYAFGNFSKSKGIANATYRVPGGGHNVMDNPIRLDDGTEWRFKDKYPPGLAPQFAGEVTDSSITTGWRPERDLGDGYSLTADLSARYRWDTTGRASCRERGFQHG